MSAIVLAVANQKGGVGKTTTTFHLARAAVQQGRRVLVVDADPQGSLTAVITAEPLDDDVVSLADVLSERTEETLRDVIVPGVWPGLDVVPTVGQTLAIVGKELVIAGPGREARLRDALAPVRDDYDVILVDCGPHLDELTTNALVAADGVVVVTQTKLFSVKGLGMLLDNIESARRYYNPQLRLTGVIVNGHQAATVSGRTWMADLEEAAQGRNLPILTPAIPQRVVISDALEAARGLDEWGGTDATELAQLYTAHMHSIEGALA